MKNRNLIEKDILASFLKVLLKYKTKNDALYASLNQIVSVDWLPIRPKGAIFLVSKENSNSLELYTNTSNFNPKLINLCSKIDFGQCICGKAASREEIIFKDCVDECHDITYDSMEPHGHYSVPFFNSKDSLLGVLVLYVEHGHKKSPSEVSFLELIAYGLGAVCERFDYEEKIITQEESLLRQKQSLDIAALVSETDAKAG